MSSAIVRARRRDLMTIRDAAGELGVHRETIVRAIETGRLRATKPTGHWFAIRRPDFEAFIDSNPMGGRS